MPKQKTNKKNIVEIDLHLFKYFKDKIEGWTFNYVWIDDLMDYINSNYKNVTKDYIRSRIFYYNILWKLEIEPITDDLKKIENKCEALEIPLDEIFREKKTIYENKKWEKIIFKDKKNVEVIKNNYYKYFLRVKITASGLSYIKELKEIIKSYSFSNRFFTYSKDFLEKVWNIKAIASIAISMFLVFWIFYNPAFVKKVMEEIPLLSSIVDSDILEWFENLNEGDEFYANIEDLMDKKSPKNPMIQKIKEVWIKYVKVKYININERLYKIKFNNDNEGFIRVHKDENGIFNLNYEKKDNLDLTEEENNEITEKENNKIIEEDIKDAIYLFLQDENQEKEQRNYDIKVDFPTDFIQIDEVFFLEDSDDAWIEWNFMVLKWKIDWKADWIKIHSRDEISAIKVNWMEFVLDKTINRLRIKDNLEVIVSKNFNQKIEDIINYYDKLHKEQWNINDEGQKNWYNRVVIKDEFDFSANLKNNKVVMSWMPLAKNKTDNFKFYKIVRSSKNSNPIYPENWYIEYSWDIWFSFYEDLDPKNGFNYYRVCAIYEKDRYCSNVKKIFYKKVYDNVWSDLKINLDLFNSLEDRIHILRNDIRNQKKMSQEELTKRISKIKESIEKNKNKINKEDFIYLKKELKKIIEQ